MNSPQSRLVFAAAMIALWSQTVQPAQASVVSYQFPVTGLSTSLSPTTSSPYLLDAGDITPWSGVSPLTGIGLNYLSLQESTAGTNTEALAVARNSYFQFTVQPETSYVMNLTSLTFEAGKSLLMGSGKNAGYAVRSSLDGYAADLGSAILTSTTNSLQTISLGAAFQGIGGPLTFRIYVFADNRLTTPIGSIPGGSKYDNITLNGAVVPEPSSLLLAASGLLVVGYVGRRRRLAKPVA